MKKNINEAIKSLSKKKSSLFHKYYSRKNGQPFPDDLLNAFLNATMDEVRLRHAVDFSTATMTLFGISDAGMFREMVLQRELFREISYDKTERSYSTYS